jgi:lytic murein transglycosylase
MSGDSIVRNIFLLAAASMAIALPAGISEAQTARYTEQGFRDYLPRLRNRALAAGVSRGTVDQVFPTLVLSTRTIELDQAQPGGTSGSTATPPFEPYRQRHVNPALIAGGQRRYQQKFTRLQEIGRRYGVEPSIIVAIYGHETSYGAITGNFDVLNSLASLAYEGRREQLFASEFIAALKMIDRGVPRSRLKSSWAGAMGYPQFLPSVYLRLAVDGDGDGQANIWQSEPDAWASIANYFSKSGWKPNTPWGVAVGVPEGFNRAAVASRLRAPRCPRVFERHSRWMTVGEWRRMGIQIRGNNVPRDSEMASLIEPDGAGRTAYLLTTNYRTILDYNCSNFYALSVGLLADEVRR